MTLVPKDGPLNSQPLDTRGKIVQGSIRLFNQSGIQNVTMRDVADSLEVSLGNLTYHFPKKKDLIHATLEILRERLAAALARPVHAVSSFQVGMEYLIRIYSTLWDFRFYFNSLGDLISDDQELRAEYYEFRDWLLDTLEADLAYLQRRGVWKKPTSPNSLRLQAENIWRIWLAWLRMYQLDNPPSKCSVNEALYDCALHHWSLSQGWLTPEYSKRLLKAFQDALRHGKHGAVSQDR